MVSRSGGKGLLYGGSNGPEFGLAFVISGWLLREKNRRTMKRMRVNVEQGVAGVGDISLLVSSLEIGLRCLNAQ